MKIQKKRDARIDILRATAILCIILAHSIPNGIIFQIRNFDVTLMVFLMGASFFLSNKGKTIKYFDYVIKRFNRLVVPTWKFLIFFFGVFYLFSLFLNDEFYFSAKEIITSFTLISGIGYVWVIKVFFIVALVSPLILYISKRIESNSLFFLILLLFYAIYALLLFVNHSFSEGYIQKLFENFLVEPFGYILVATFGIRLFNLKKKDLIYLSGAFLIIFLVLMVYHNYAPIQDFKYPPTFYYQSYGLFFSFFLFYFLSNNRVMELFNKKSIIFLSKYSLDLYFCHIIPIYIIVLYSDYFPIINVNFITRFLFLLIGGLIILVLKNGFLKLIKLIKVTSKNQNF